MFKRMIKKPPANRFRFLENQMTTSLHAQLYAWMSSLQPLSNQTARAGHFRQPVCSQTQIPILQDSSGSVYTPTELCGKILKSHKRWSENVSCLLSNWHVVTQSPELRSGCPGLWGQLLLQPMFPASVAWYPVRESELLYQEQVVNNVMTLLFLPEPAEALWQWDYFYDLISIVSCCLIIGVKEIIKETWEPGNLCLLTTKKTSYLKEKANF